MKRHHQNSEMEKLPKEIIQHIQSFMNGKEAARTSLLSKSWFSAWLTRPNLSFNQVDFRHRQFYVFSDFTKNTMQRYEVSNLKIVSFHLQFMDVWGSNSSTYISHSLAKELIVRAIKLGATDVEIKTPDSSRFVLPDEVLASLTLARLSVSGCRVNLRRRVACSNLKSLILHHVDVYGDMFKDLLSRCPLLEYLSLDSLFFEGRRCNKLPSLVKDLHIRAPLWHQRKALNIASWLSSLSKLVKMLRNYRVSVTIDVIGYSLKASGGGGGYKYVGDGLPRPVLESLRIKGSEVNRRFLDNLFLICRPKMIIQECIRCDPINEDLVEVEENVKLLEERFSKWRAKPWMKVLDDSMYESKVVRFQLRWNLAHSAAPI